MQIVTEQNGNQFSYLDKNPDYFQYVRKEVLDLIPGTHRDGNVLEIGCGGCATLSYAKKSGYAKHVYGVDIVEINMDPEISAALDKIVIGDIQKIENPFYDIKFDVILCPDVLEHLIDPYTTLQKLSGWLKEDGVMIASVPNINYWKIVRDLIFRDSFKYTNYGILDRTHLRFFAGVDVRKLFEENGYSISVFTRKLGGSKKVQFAINILFPITRLFYRFFTYQYLVVARRESNDRQ